MSTAIITNELNGVLTIIINRPEARNAVNGAVATGIAAAIERLDNEDGLVVGIITGASGNFCAGMDLKGFLTGEQPFVEGKGFAGLVDAPPRKPLIAAVNGYALAGGFEIALACDMIIASEQATFGLPEVKRSLVAAAGALYRMPKQLPQKIAMELLLTGEPISAQRAYEIGLVNHVVTGDAMGTAQKIAGKIRANGPLAVLASKDVVNRAGTLTEEELRNYQNETIMSVFSSEDAKEGAKAFAEKRKPVWQGK